MYGIGLNGSLWMGAQSLNAQQTAIETIGNNISNLNTPGYSRERVNLASTTTTEGGSVQGDGVVVSNIESLRSNMLDNLVKQSLGDQGYADNSASLTSTVQDALGEQFTAAGSTTTSGTVTSGSGPIQDAMSQFFSAMQNLASTPSDGTARQVVVQNAQSLSTAINGAYQRVQQTQTQIASDATSVTTQINQLSQNIASLNKQITQVEAATGTQANDLRDNREADIEQLSGLVNVTATEQTSGAVTVTLADNSAVTLVSGVNAGGAGGTQTLSAAYNANAAVPLTVSASTTGALGTGIPSGGSLGADLDVANNVIGSSTGGTGILGGLDSIAKQVITQVNAQNADGYDLTGAAGGAIFTGTGAADIAVKSTVTANPSLIAAGNGSGPLDGSNALAMSQIQNNAGVTPALQTLVANLGQTVNTAATTQSTQDAITQQLQTQRNSVSGVSLDEEMTNLINFQQAYDASARFITTISGLYDTLVNNTQ